MALATPCCSSQAWTFSAASNCSSKAVLPSKLSALRQRQRRFVKAVRSQPCVATLHEVRSRDAKDIDDEDAGKEGENVSPAYATRYSSKALPKNKLPKGPMSKDAAYQFVRDELMLDGNPHMNLASFLTTWMEPECDKLMTESMNKNFVDADEYPATMELQNRCVNMIARLCNAPLCNNDDVAVGVSTVGSSEGILLSGLAFKLLWKKKMQAKGRKPEELLHPNIVMGANAQIVWEKLGRYFDVEVKTVPVSEHELIMNPKKAVDMVDENTICVAVMFGSTYTGEFEDVKAINDLLMEKNKQTGWDTPIHVDAASGGFVAPFLWPELEWDFRLPLVKAINLSGHKYGLVYPGCGWNIWRSKAELPEELVFHITYLGSDQATATLNFSRSSSGVVGQYYQFIRLGFDGYREIMANCWAQVHYLRQRIAKLGHFRLMSAEDQGVPVVAFRLQDTSKYNEHDIAYGLRSYGWIVPAYNLPPDVSHVTILRVVVREDFTRTLAEKLADNLQQVVEDLEAHPKKQADKQQEKPKTVRPC